MKKHGLLFKLLPAWYNPVNIFENFFAQEKNSFWLDSSLHNTENRYSYMGANPDKIFTYSLKNSRVILKSNGKTRYIPSDIFSVLDRALQADQVTHTALPFDFTGGFVGYFGYELKMLNGSKNRYYSPYPDSIWYFVDLFIAFDHKKKKVFLVYPESKKKAARELFQKIISGVSRPAKKRLRILNNKNIVRPVISYPHAKNDYMQLVNRCKSFLANGQSYQICLTNTIKVTGTVDPFILYKILREKNPAPYSAYFAYKSLTILSASPEEFLKINKERAVQTKPIKGTIGRGKTKMEDEKMKKLLVEDKKEWSENAMIVDLLRNDLGKVCDFGSIRVDNAMQIETFKTVHQLVSTVSGRLKKNASLIDCIKACFPGGSMTGAPKIHTVHLLDSLEKQARGIYSGSLGYLSRNRTLLLSVVIRTIIIQKNELTIGTGGAVLMDSQPEKEYEEMLLKANALLESIKQAVYTTPMHTVYLALGSNVGNKKEYINKAVETLKKDIKNMQIAKIYETKPMYYENQDSFLNTVISGETALSPDALLLLVKKIEKNLGRKKRFTNGPREIDIDLLFYDHVVHASNDLIIPHPRISEREFVLKPFADIAPDFIHPVYHKRIGALLKEIQKKS